MVHKSVQANQIDYKKMFFNVLLLLVVYIFLYLTRNWRKIGRMELQK